HARSFLRHAALSHVGWDVEPSAVAVLAVGWDKAASSGRRPTNFHKHGITVLISGRTAAEELERRRARVRDCMNRAGRNRDGVAGPDGPRFVADRHPARAFQ